MPVTAANYDEILELSEDPTLDEDTRSRMKADLETYATQKQVGGAALQLSPPMQSSVDAMEAGGMHRPMSRDDWSRQYKLRKSGEVSKDVARQIDAGMTQAFVEDDPDNSVVTLTQPIKGQEAVFMDELKGSLPDDELSADLMKRLAKEWGYNPENPGGAITTEGDPTAASLQNIEEQAEQDKLLLGLDEIDEGLPAASKQKRLYAPPEFIPRGVSLMDAATAGYFEEPPLELVKQAMRPRIQGAADSLTEDSPEYKRYADALWKQTYEEAERAGRPVVRIKYMNTDDWLGKAAQVSARALGTALPFASGVDKSLTGGVASTALTGVLDAATGGKGDVRRSMIEQERRRPLAAAGGAVVGALAPGGLVGRTYSGVASGIARPGAGFAARMAGAGIGGIAAGGVSSAAPDIVQNLGEAALSDNPRYHQPHDIASRAVMASALGLPFGLAGEAIGTLAGKGVAALREGRRGKALADLEQAGMSTGGPFSEGGIPPNLSGVKRSAALKDVRARAAKEQRSPEDVLLGEIKDGLSARARKRMEQSGVRTSAEPDIPSNDEILAFRSKPGREEPDEALFNAAEDAGFAEELLLLRGLKAADEIQEAARPRAVLGSQGSLSAYAGNPGEVIALRADPLMRALSMREPLPGKTIGSLRAADISEDLLHFLRSFTRAGARRAPARPPLAKNSDVVSLPDPLNPIQDVARGARGMGSARQLGASGAAGTSKAKRKYTISDLSYEEQQILARLVELAAERQRPAASGE